MNQDILQERLFETLISGDRHAARAIVDESLQQGVTPERVVSDLFWPTYEKVEKLFRADQLTPLCQHMATRLLRVLVDQTAARFTRQLDRGRSVFAFCGPTDADELGAQMAVDLLEGDGYTMYFAGSGVANDELLNAIQQQRPEALLLFASAPADLPDIRQLIDKIHEIGACNGIQVIVGGGVFNRADGLAEEIGADLWASTPEELVREMAENPDRRATADQRTVGRSKRQRAVA